MRLREYLEIQNGLKSKLKEALTIPSGLTAEEFDEWVNNNWEDVFKEASIDDILTWYYTGSGPAGYTIREWAPDYGHAIRDKCCTNVISLVDLVTSSLYKHDIDAYVKTLPAKVTPKMLAETVDEIVYRFLVGDLVDNETVDGVFAYNKISDAFLYFIPDTTTQYTDTMVDVLHINYDDEMELNAADAFIDNLEALFTKAGCTTWGDAVSAITTEFSSTEF